MKKIIYTLMIALTMMFVVNFSTSAQYCQPYTNYTCCMGISNFVFNQYSNNTGGNNIYTYFPDTSNLTALTGNNYFLEIDGYGYSQNFYVWIDWNHNGSFMDPGEFYYIGDAMSVTTSLNIPLTATPGITRMRVQSEYDYSSPITDPCNNLQYGETEDYSLNVVSTLPLLVYAPVKGSVLMYGVNSTVSWSSTQSNPVNIDYSVDQGNTWNSIATGVSTIANSGNNYYWTPSDLGASYKAIIRVSDGVNTAYSDTFNLQKVAVKLLTPLTGKVYTAGDTISMRVHLENISDLSMYLSPDNGITYPNSYYFGYNTPGDTTINYIIPLGLATGNLYKIAVYDDYHGNLTPGYTAYSDSFTINAASQKIQIVSPAMGDFYAPNTNLNVSWNSNLVYLVNIDFSLNNGNTWNSIYSNYNSYDGYSVYGNNGYFWTTPDTITSEYPNCLIRVVSSTDTSVKSFSKPFSISALQQIIFVAPVKTDAINSTDTFSVILNNKGNNVSGYLNYSTDGVNYYGCNNGFNNYITLHHGINVFKWGTPFSSVNINNVRLEYNYWTLQEVNSIAYSDSFSLIAQPTISINDPMYNATLAFDRDFTIDWNSSNVSAVKIEYYDSRISQWELVVDNYNTSDGYNSYVWHTPTSSGYNSMGTSIRITDIAKSNIVASVGYFTLNTASVQILTPLAGKTFSAGDTVSFQYKLNDYTYYNYLPIYLNANGSSYFIDSKNYLIPGTYSESYVIPSTQDSSSNTQFLLGYSYYPNYMYDVSGTFKINRHPSFIQMNTPISGAFLQTNSSIYVYWQSAWVDSVNIDYSTDGGTTWHNVISGYPNYNYDYISIPAVSGTFSNSRLRVSNNKGTVYSISGQLTISDTPPVSFISPAKNANWQAGVPDTIKIQNSTGQSFYINLYFANNSYYVSYLYLPASSATSFVWYKPGNLPLGNNTLQAYNPDLGINVNSDTFNMLPAPPQIQITSPVSSNYYYTGNWRPISWTYVNIDTIRIEHSLDGGITWKSDTILPSYYGDGTYYWQIPNVGGTFKNSVVRVSMKSNPAVNAVSSPFTLSNIPPVSFSYPVNRDTIVAGTTISIIMNNIGEWINYNGGIELQYSLDHKVTWNDIGYPNSFLLGKNTFNWSIPGYLQYNGNLSIRANYYSNDWGTDSGIVLKPAPPSITVSSPVAGDFLKSGINNTLVFTTVNVDTVSIEFTNNAGKNWNLLNSSFYYNMGTNYYSFTPNGNSDSCQFRIKWKKNPQVVGFSSYFTVSGASPIKIIKPAGGESVQAGKNLLIQYKLLAGASSNDYLYVYNDSSGYQNNIFNNYQSKGDYSFIWSVPESLNGGTKFRIIGSEQFEETQFTDTSNYFTILPASPRLDISYPSNGSVLRTNQLIYINYTAVSVNMVRIYFSSDGAKNWTLIGDSVPSTYYSNYPWNPNPAAPVGWYSNNCYLKITNLTGTISSLSQQFTLTNEKPGFTITSPKKGDIYQVGQWITVTYKSTMNYSNPYLSMSVDGGNTYPYSNYSYLYAYYGINNIQFYLPDTLPGSTKCLFKLKYDTLKSISDTFSITPKPPVINSISDPNNSSWWVQGKTGNVSWTSVNVKLARISLSIDAGKTWNTLFDSIPSHNGNNSFTVPINPNQTISKFAVIKVESVDKTTFATSSIFNISSYAAYFKLVTPKGGEIFTAGQTINLVFDNYGPPTYAFVNISYDGHNWTPVQINSSNNYVSQGRVVYPVTLPQDAPLTDSARIKVLSSGGEKGSGTTLPDSSMPFTIKPMPPYITVSEPSTGWIYFSNSNWQTIKWNSVHVDKVRIEYSDDNQNNWQTVVDNYPTNNGSNSANPYFVIPDTFSINSFYKITDLVNDTIVGISSRFTTSNKADTMFIYSPAGGESFAAGSDVPINFMYQGRYRNNGFNVYYSLDGGVTRTQFNYTTVNFGNQRIDWYIPTNLDSASNVVIIFEDLYSYGVSPLTIKSKPFSINGLKPSITIYNPNNYSDFWVSNSYQTISWGSVKVSNVDIDLSVDNGKSWSSLGQGIISSGYNTINVSVPTIAVYTDSAKVRIKSSSDSTLVAYSDYFTLSNLSPYLEILEPKAGETFQAGNNYKLQFNNHGLNSSNFDASVFDAKTGLSYELQFNNNGNGNSQGKNWANKGYNEMDFSFPEIMKGSDQCKVILTVTYYNNNNGSQNTVVDSSAGYFTVLPASAKISVQQPTLNAYIVGGSLTPVSWYNVNVDTVKIEFSKDAGFTWSIVANKVACINGTNNFDWTVPVVAAEYNNSRIKITSTQNGLVFDVSKPFTVSNITPVLSMITPNGGESYQAGKSYFIKFNYTGNNTHGANLFYSFDAGYSWNQLGKSQQTLKGINYYLWQIQSEATPYYLIKVQLDNLTAISDTTFTVTAGAPQLNIYNPSVNDGYIISGSRGSINWYSTSIDSVDIDYSIDGGVTWNSLYKDWSIYNGYNSLGWDVPYVSGGFAPNSVMRVRNSNDTNFLALSNFVISANTGYITIINPDSSTIWTAGNNQTIDFNIVGLPVTGYYSFNLAYGNNQISLNNGGSPIGTHDTTGLNIKPGKNSYNITLPNNLPFAKDARVLIQTYNYNNGQQLTFTSKKFILNPSPAGISIKDPNQGSYLIGKDQSEVDWYSINAGRVNVDFSPDKGLSWKSIKSAYGTTNGYNTISWIVPDTTTNNAMVRIISIDSTNAYAQTNPFTIYNGAINITIQSPLGGDVYHVGGPFDLKYTYSGGTSEVMIAVSLDNGKTWENKGNLNTVHGKNEMLSTIGYDQPTSDSCRIKLTDERGNSVTSSVFAIKPPLSFIAVKLPNYGDQLLSNETYPIGWSSFGEPNVNIVYSTDSGKSWNTVINNLPNFNGDNVYYWKVPAISGTDTSLIKIVSSSDTVKGLSEAFVISNVPASFSIEHPVLNETFYSGNYLSIRYKYSGFANKQIDLLVSLDAGVSWNLANENGTSNYYAVPGENSIKLLIPYNIVSDHCLVRIEDSSDPSLYAVSPEFKIVNSSTSIVLTAPIANTYWITGTIATIGWNSYLVGKVKIEFSTDSAKTWQLVKNNVISYDGKNIYNWTVPSIDTTHRNSYIRITDVDDAGIVDSSAAITLSNAYPSSEARLAQLYVDVAPVDSFSNSKYNYDYYVPFSTSVPPPLHGVPVDKYAKTNVVNSTVVPGTSWVDVIAEDGNTTLRYQVSFHKKSPSNEAFLKEIRLDGKLITGFASGTFNYSVFYRYDTLPPVATALATTAGAKVEIIQTTNIPGTITIKVTAESDTLSNTYNVNITTNLPPVLANTTLNVDENSPANTVVGTVVATDAEGDAVLYSIIGGNTGNAFKLHIATSGEILVNNKSALNYEVTPIFALQMRVYEKFHPALADTAVITINLNNVNDPPVFKDQSLRIAENLPSDSVIGSIKYTDEDVGQAHVFNILGGNDNGIFDVDFNTGAIKIKDGSMLNYHVFDSLGISNPTRLNIEIDDAGGLSASATVSIFVMMATNTTFTKPEIPQGVNMMPYDIGTVQATEGDTTLSLSYSIISGNTGNAFKISSATGDISVLTPSQINYEQNPLFNLGVQISDNGTPSFSLLKSVTINITNVNDPPIIHDTTFNVPIFAQVNDTVGILLATDQDAGDALSYAITAASVSGVFAINSTTGVITVAKTNPLNTYGSFDLTIAVSDNGLPLPKNILTTTVHVTIDVKYSVVADFDYSIAEGTKNVTFTSKSSPNVTNFYWTFGDGTSGQGNEITHNYPKEALWNACLTVFDNNHGLSDKICKSVLIGAPTCTMFADFDTTIVGDSVYFTDKSNGNIATWYWNFGDNTTSFDRNPKHLFPSPGFYLVSLSVSDTLKKCIDYTSEFIQVGTVDCHADFNFITGHDTAYFTNNSKGASLTYYWDFGDGLSASSVSPTHTFAKDGIYQVSLTVSSGATCMDNLVIPVQVGNVSCSAHFTYTVDTVNYTVYFNEDLIGASTNLLWTFGDGHASVEHNPSHHFGYPGFYTVGLNTYNKFGANGGCMDFYEEVITVGNAGRDCQADFMYQVTPGTTDVKFTDNSKGNIEFYIWNFGDGNMDNNLKHAKTSNQYAAPGFYNVCLDVINNFDVSNITCKKIGVGTLSTNCSADFEFSDTAQTASFTDKSMGSPNKWEWNFGDSIVGTTQNPSHAYSYAGYKLVSLKITTPSNCNDKTYKLVGINKPGGLKVGFGYNALPQKKSGGYPVDFIGVGLGDQARLRWTFGDSTTNSDTTTTTPTYTYTNPGNHYVCYAVTDPITGQGDTTCQWVATTTTDIPVITTNSSGSSVSAYPNPFVNNTTIAYELNMNTEVNLKVLDFSGRLIKTIVNTTKEKGKYSINWDGSGIESGSYILQLKTNYGSWSKIIVKQ